MQFENFPGPSARYLLPGCTRRGSVGAMHAWTSTQAAQVRRRAAGLASSNLPERALKRKPCGIGGDIRFTSGIRNERGSG